MEKFVAFAQRSKAWFRSCCNRRTCRHCGVKGQRDDMRRVTVIRETRHHHAVRFLLNLRGLLLGNKPSKQGFIKYLFGHRFMALDRKKEPRWLCFNCFIQVLTPKEYAQFRDAYYEDLVVEDGQQKATQSLASMDAVFDAREEATQ